MLTRDHPDDERLSALASGDTDALGDSSLSAHVTSCDRCAGVVRDLTVLRSALGELPDVAPSRPLRLLPPVEADAPVAASAADRLGLWARRLFGPALTAGAVVAMIGLVGTSLPAIEDMASGQAAAPEEAPAAAELADEAERMTTGAPGAEEDAAAPFSAEEPESGTGAGGDLESGEADDGATTFQGDDAAERAAAEGAEDALPAERSVWPMVLFAGVALMVAAALLRWILAPRAG